MRMFIFLHGYLIILFNQLAPKIYVTKQNQEIMSFSMRWLLTSLKSHSPYSEKTEGFYKADNCINDIIFGASLFVFCNSNTYFQ